MTKGIKGFQKGHPDYSTQESKLKQSIRMKGNTYRKGFSAWNNLGKTKEYRNNKLIRIGKRTIPHSHFIWASQKENLPYIPKGFVIHHIDFNTSNDNPNNLLLLPKKWHNQLHNNINKELIREGTWRG